MAGISLAKGPLLLLVVRMGKCVVNSGCVLLLVFVPGGAVSLWYCLCTVGGALLVVELCPVITLTISNCLVGKPSNQRSGWYGNSRWVVQGLSSKFRCCCSDSS